MNDFSEDHVGPTLEVGAPEEPLGEAFAPLFENLANQIAASDAENRRTARRLLEGLKGFGTVLDAMATTLGDLHAGVRTLNIPSPAPAPRAPNLAPAFIELTDRLDRIEKALAKELPAEKTWWPAHHKTLEAWRSERRLLTESFSLLEGQKNAIFQSLGLARIPSADLPFDPACMTAVEVVPDASRPDHTVLQEILPGWRDATSGEIIRFAQVRVSRRA
jgi:hypothetical protein